MNIILQLPMFSVSPVTLLHRILNKKCRMCLLLTKSLKYRVLKHVEVHFSQFNMSHI